MMSYNLIIESVSYLHKVDSQNTTGAAVASGRIIESLIRHPSQHNLYLLGNCTQKEFNQIASKNHWPERIKPASFLQFESLLNQGLKPDLFFSSGLTLNELMHLRNHYKLQAPVIGLVHDLGEFTSFDRIARILRLCTYLDGIICPSKSTLHILNKIFDVLNQTPGLQTIHIPYGIDTQKFSPVPDKTALRKRFGLPENKVILLHLSRLNPKTKMDMLPLIQNAAALAKTCPQLFTLIVGEPHDNAYVNQLQAYIRRHQLESHIRIITDNTQQNIQEYYQLADIFISLADRITENFGLTVIEAMACGLPCIIADSGGHRGLIQNDHEGYMIPSITAEIKKWDILFNTLSSSDFGDLLIQGTALPNDAIRKAITKLVLDSSLRRQYGQNARKKACNEYTLTHMTQNYINFFETMIERSKKAPKLTYPKMCYSQLAKIFRHGATNHLSKNSRFQLSELGKHSVKTKQLPDLFEKHLNYYNLIAPILLALAQKTHTVESLRNSLAIKDTDTLYQNLIFLLKHDLIILNNTDSTNRT